MNFDHTCCADYNSFEGNKLNRPLALNSNLETLRNVSKKLLSQLQHDEIRILEYEKNPIVIGSLCSIFCFPTPPKRFRELGCVPLEHTIESTSDPKTIFQMF